MRSKSTVRDSRHRFAWVARAALVVGPWLLGHCGGEEQASADDLVDGGGGGGGRDAMGGAAGADHRVDSGRDGGGGDAMGRADAMGGAAGADNPPYTAEACLQRNDGGCPDAPCSVDGDTCEDVYWSGFQCIPYGYYVCCGGIWRGLSGTGICCDGTWLEENTCDGSPDGSAATFDAGLADSSSTLDASTPDASAPDAASTGREGGLDGG